MICQDADKQVSIVGVPIRHILKYETRTHVLFVHSLARHSGTPCLFFLDVNLLNCGLSAGLFVPPHLVKPPLCKGRCRANARRRDCKIKGNDNPSVAFGASSLCTREPWFGVFKQADKSKFEIRTFSRMLLKYI